MGASGVVSRSFVIDEATRDVVRKMASAALGTEIQSVVSLEVNIDTGRCYVIAVDINAPVRPANAPSR